ncbi:Fur family transcriptional regulator [Marinisporobacter balticus]|uniref:Fur family zinc uptake transcriptional regulator/Fur family ferric uptake transcriptional regulator n=1 Tax=Marinisporobacter balticus TaxID=2018667 RepID=A0A4R2KXQ0_9FIRM|nr:Fur family transcriptional regulator [Marinisporobacter balticus]TCO78713.1 Fur family zinc uptake transcriptional regulator/Fur family ferric uptake transcriptional regulator [Marinisporobacter balticus]
MTIQNQIEQKLKDHGYKLTLQRKTILEVLLKNKNHFLSAEEIYLQTKEKYAQTNFSTIYRNLEILENIEMIHKINIHGATSQYEFISHNSHHHHIICKGCGKTELIDFCPLEEILDKLNHPDFTFTDHKFELYGYCTSCKEKTCKK